MKRTLASLAAASVLAIAAAAPTLADQGAAPDPRRGDKVDRIIVASMADAYFNTTRDTVIVPDRNGDKYLVEVTGCPNLEEATEVGFLSATTSITRGDGVSVDGKGERTVTSYRAAATASNLPATGIDPYTRRPIIERARPAGFSDTCAVSAIYKWNPEA